jgi:hypothetical protein
MQSTRYSRQILVNLEFSQQIFQIYSDIKFHENPSSGSRVISRGRADGRTDMTKLTVACNFAKAPKNTNNAETAASSHSEHGY